MCLHFYDQQIEIPQWNKRHFQHGSLLTKVLKACMFLQYLNIFCGSSLNILTDE